MKKVSKWWWLLLLPVVFLGLALLGFYYFSYDNTAKFAKALIYPKGHDDQFIASVLNLRFPPGTPAAEVEVLVKSVGGHYSRCKREQADKLVCSFGLAGVICAATTLEITAEITSENKVKRLNAKSIGQYC